MKQLFRKLHLWLALACGLFFVLLGLTGSVIAWRDDLDRWLNPELLTVAPTQQRQDAPVLVERVLARLAADPRYGRPEMLTLPEHRDQVAVAWYRRPNADPFWLPERRLQVMLDPATLNVVGERIWGESGLSRRQLMPTIFHWHRYLLSGQFGKTVVAALGLVMLAIAASGLVMWWPKPTFSALWKAVTVRFSGSWPRLNFTLHRAAGLFAAPVLLVLGFTGSYFNAPAWTLPAIQLAGTVTPVAKLVNRSAGTAAIAPTTALAAAQAAFPQGRISLLALPARPGLPFEIRLRQPGELRHGAGATRIFVDAGDGALLRVHDPLQARGGDRLVSWLFPLHSGEAFGTPGRVFISLFGLAPLMFFVTGVFMWLKKRR